MEIIERKIGERIDDLNWRAVRVIGVVGDRVYLKISREPSRAWPAAAVAKFQQLRTDARDGRWM